jgi:hypothetical protein
MKQRCQRSHTEMIRTYERTSHLHMCICIYVLHSVPHRHCSKVVWSSCPFNRNMLPVYLISLRPYSVIVTAWNVLKQIWLTFGLLCTGPYWVTKLTLMLYDLYPENSTLYERIQYCSV